MAARPMASCASRELPPMCGVPRKVGIASSRALDIRLRRKHIGRRAGQSTALERGGQGRLIDQPATRCIDQERAGLPSARSAAAPIIPRVLESSGTCSDTIVGFGQQLVASAHRRHIVRTIELGVVADVVREHPAGKRLEQLHQILADMTATDDAKRAAGQFAADQLVPPAAPEANATSSGTRCSSAMANVSVSSATDRRLTPPVHASRTPRRAIAARSRPSSPTPYLLITRSSGTARQHLVVDALESDNRRVVTAQKCDQRLAGEDRRPVG